MLFYREKEARAARLAREMGASSTAIELENGDEEEAFSAVQRGPQRQDSDGGKYVTPARRQSSGSNASTTSKPQQQQMNSGGKSISVFHLKTPFLNHRLSLGRQQRSTPPPSSHQGGGERGGPRNDMHPQPRGSGGGRMSSERDYHHGGGRDQHQPHDDYNRGGGAPHERQMQPRRSGGNYGTNALFCFALYRNFNMAFNL